MIITPNISFSYKTGTQISGYRKMKIKAANPQLFLVLLLMLSLFIETTLSNPRSETVKIICETQLEHNTTAYVPNFIAAMSNIIDQMRTKGYGQSNVGTGPDGNYGFAQCYGDLSLFDCLLCYAEARVVLPQCYPYNGGRVFLDGCFLRAQNYSFYEEFTGPNDKAICGNSTQMGTRFQDTAKKAVVDTAAAAVRNGGYAKAEVKVSASGNESVYVLADCWKILNSSSCRACLENASASMVGCLPWSEGRAINTGCFMRYSDKDFLNKEQTTESFKGKTTVLTFVRN